MVEAQHGTSLAADLLLVVSSHQESHGGTSRTGRRLDHMGHVSLPGPRVAVFEPVAGSLRMLLQIKISAVSDPLQFVPPPGE